MSQNPVSYEVVTATARLTELVASHAGEARYALDTEFLQQRTYVARLALVQLAWPDEIVLIDPFAVDLSVLTPLFRSDATALLHAASNDLPLLESAVGVLPTRLFDTEIAAHLLGLPSASLANLTSSLLDIRLDKTEQLRDWTVRPLPATALTYAAHDVAHLFDLVDTMSADLEFCDRLSAHEQECAYVLATLDESDGEALWWRTKELHRASVEEKLRAQFLFEARDQIARDLNLPRNWVLNEEELAGLCRRPPATFADLATQLAGSRLSTSDVEELWRALEHAADAPSEVLWPHDADLDDGELGLQLTLARFYSRYVAHRWEVNASFMASHRDLVKFFRHLPSRLDIPWRHDALGADMAKIRDGQATLRLDGPELLFD